MNTAFGKRRSTRSTGKPVRENLTQRVVQMIEDMIVAGKLSPGQRLVESELAEQLGVSRLPVREAMRILAGDGVVELVPHSNPRMRKMTPVQVGEMLKVLVGMMFVAIDELDERPDRAAIVKQLMVRARAIEAARHRGAAQEVLSEMTKYQEELVEASRNEYLQSLVRKAHFGNYQVQVQHASTSEVAIAASACYIPVTQALAEGKAESAKKLLKRSLGLWIKVLNPSPMQ